MKFLDPKAQSWRVDQRAFLRQDRKPNFALIYRIVRGGCVAFRNVTRQSGEEKELQRISLCSREDEKYFARYQGLRYFSETSPSLNRILQIFDI